MAETVDYGWLKEERAFRMDVKEAGYSAREIVPVGEQTYDPQLIFCPNQDCIRSLAGHSTNRLNEFF